MRALPQCLPPCTKWHHRNNSASTQLLLPDVLAKQTRYTNACNTYAFRAFARRWHRVQIASYPFMHVRHGFRSRMAMVSFKIQNLQAPRESMKINKMHKLGPKTISAYPKYLLNIIPQFKRTRNALLNEINQGCSAKVKCLKHLKWLDIRQHTQMQRVYKCVHSKPKTRVKILNACKTFHTLRLASGYANEQ